MIKDMKLGMNMLRHAYGLKTNVLLGVMFVVFGTLVYLWGADMRMEVLGEYLIMCAGIFPAQMLYSLSASSLIQSSPAKKKMQTAVPALITWTYMMILYLLHTAVRAVMLLKQPDMAASVGSQCIVIAVMMVFLMIYIGVVYKYFFSSIIIIMLAVSFLNSGEGIRLQIRLFGADSLGFGASVGLGILLLAAGGLLQYLISLLVYKVPLSRMAQSARLRREL